MFIALSGLSFVFVSIIGAICYYCCHCRNKKRSTHASTCDSSIIHHHSTQIASVKGSISECDNLSNVDINKSATVTLTNAGVDALSAAQLTSSSPSRLIKLQQLHSSQHPHSHSHPLTSFNQYQHQILHDQQQSMLLHQLQPMPPAVTLQGSMYQLYSSDDSSKYITTYTGIDDDQHFNDITDTNTFNSATLKLIPKHMLIIDPTCPAHSTFISSSSASSATTHTLPRVHHIKNHVPTDELSSVTPPPSSQQQQQQVSSSDLITIASNLQSDSRVNQLISSSSPSCHLSTLNCLLHDKQNLINSDELNENISSETVTEEDESTEQVTSSIAALSLHSTNETDAEINAAAAETAASAFALYELMSCKNVFY